MQVRGHQRVPSDSKEFHEVTKRDAQTQLEVELDKLLKTSNDELKPFLGGEMTRFSTLFSKFLSEVGPSVDWEKIQKLPEDAVRHYATLSAPKEDQVKKIFFKEKIKFFIELKFFLDSPNAGQIGCNKIEWWFGYIYGLPWTEKCDSSSIGFNIFRFDCSTD